MSSWDEELRAYIQFVLDGGDRDFGYEGIVKKLYNLNVSKMIEDAKNVK